VTGSPNERRFRGSGRHSRSVWTSLCPTRVPSGGLSCHAGKVTFQLTSDAQAITFDGELRDTTLSGTVTVDGREGTFEFFRSSSLSPSESAKYAGIYRFDNGRVISIGRLESPHQVDTLVFADAQSGRAGTLIVLANGDFVSGPAILDGYPFEVRAKFQRGSGGQGSVTWRQNGWEKRAIKIAIREVHAECPSNGQMIRGMLLEPEGSKPTPAVVMVPGSMPQTRYGSGPDPYVLAGQGMSVLVYDKRGCGESGGNCDGDFPVSVLSSDLASAVQFLVKRPEIDRKRVGVLGLSQGGWLVHAIAANSRDVAFVIVIAGSGLSTDRNNRFEIDSDLRLRGFLEAVRAQMQRLQDLRWAVVRAPGIEWRDFQLSAAAASTEPWYGFARLPRSLLESSPPASRIASASTR
jgi:uncharacterized protein